MTDTNIEQSKMAIISTAHLTENCAKKISDSPSIATNEYCFFISTFDEQTQSKLYGQSLVDCVTYLRDQGFDYICFDRDANTISFLPEYDW